MRKQVDPHIDVTSHDPRVLIALPIENVVMRVRDALLDGHFYHLLGLFHTLAFTALALVLLVHDHTHPVAFLTWSLDLRVHAWPQLGHLQDNTFALAIGTRLGIGSALSLTISADPHASDLHFLHLPTEDLFESDIDFDQFGLGLLGTLVLLVEVVEDVSASLGRPSILDSLLAVLIVELPLLGVQQSIVGFLELLELMWIASLIGMLLERTLTEGLLDLLGSGILGHFQQLVVSSGVDLLLAGSLGGLLLLLLPLVLPLVVLVARVEEHTTKNQ